MFKWIGKLVTAKNAAHASADSADARDGNSPGEVPLPEPVFELPAVPPETAFSHGILARQVLVDRAYHPAAYEFSLRAEGNHSGISSTKILAGVLNRLGSSLLSAGRQAWVRIKDVELADATASTLDHEHTVLIVELTRNGETQDGALLDHARRLRAEGYRLALAHWTNSEREHAWLPLCAFVEVCNSTTNPVDIGSWPEKLAALEPNVAAVACEIDSWEDLEYCHRQGYQFFRGQFLSKRETWPRQPKIAPERAMLIDLLRKINAGAEVAEVAEALKKSPELSYRLLRYINSAGIGAGSRVASIQQGLILLGRDKVYRWLTVLLFSSGGGKSLDSALLEQALVRARLMELAATGRFDRIGIDELFVVGIFSLLDILLKLPMSVAIESLNLPTLVAGALLGQGQLNAYSPYLNLAIASEDGNHARLSELAAELALSLSQVNTMQVDALVWMRQTVDGE